MKKCSSNIKISVQYDNIDGCERALVNRLQSVVVMKGNQAITTSTKYLPIGYNKRIIK